MLVLKDSCLLKLLQCLLLLVDVFCLCFLWIPLIEVVIVLVNFVTFFYGLYGLSKFLKMSTVPNWYMGRHNIGSLTELLLVCCVKLLL